MCCYVRQLRTSGISDDLARTFPFTLPAVRGLDGLNLSQPVTFFIGENGSGKSSIVEAIAILAGFNPEGGTKNFRTALRPTESDLFKHLRLVRSARRERTGFFLRAETMFNVSTEAESYRVYGWEDLHTMSHGEAFLWIVQNRLGPRGLFIFDEPEAALSPQRQIALLRVMYDRVAEGSQFIVSTHSPILMSYPGATIYLLNGAGVTAVEYKQTEHYAVTRGFLENPDRVLRDLLSVERDTGTDEP